MQTVVYNIYGKETTDGLIDINYEYEDIKITGVIGKPEIARNNRAYQQFFVNKRYIKDKTLQAGAEQAFKGLLPIGKFGFLILNLEMEPNKIDVNVHPTKLEIRFQEEQKVFKAVYHAIKEGLLKADLIKNTEKNIDERIQLNNILKQNKIENVQEKIEQTTTAPTQENDKLEEVQTEQIQELQVQEEPKQEDIQQDIPEKNIELNEKEEEIENKNMAQIAELVGSTDETIRIPTIMPEESKQTKKGLFSLFRKKEEDIEQNVEENAIEQIFAYKNNTPYNTTENETTDEKTEKINFEEMYSKTFGVNREEKNEKVETVTDYSLTEKASNISMFEDKEEYSQVPPYKYCGSVFSTYLIIEMGNEMYIIDQHAAHERVMYEQIKKNYYQNAEKDSQIMLLPDIITLSHKEKLLVQENVELFRRAGFIIEEFGENTIRLIGVPSICMDLDTKELFLEILDTIDTVAITATQEKEDKFIATIACKAAVKAKMALTKEEVDELMKKLLVLPNPFTCPHGRPTAIKMEKNDIERKFNRRK